MTELMNFVRKIADSEATTILIQGESGTGKDLIAKAIHYQSRRQDKSFIAINCSAIPETLMEAELFGHERGAFTDAKAMKKGLFEMADGGTLFLDEIGELSPLLQAKLLRVLEDQVIRRVGGVRDMQVDVRVIAASNRDLERAVAKADSGRISITGWPSSRISCRLCASARKISCRWLNTSSDATTEVQETVLGITDEMSRLLLKHEWPGNVRELKNAIERAMILEEEDHLRPDYLPFAVGPAHAGADGVRSAVRRQPTMPTHVSGRAETLPRTVYPSRVEHHWNRWNGHWSRWHCSRPTAIRRRLLACWTSAVTRFAIS